MFNALGMGQISVDVATSEGGGHNPEFWAKRATSKIISVSETAPPFIKEQALTYRNQIEAMILYYIKEAIKDNNSMLINSLVETGNGHLADFVRRV